MSSQRPISHSTFIPATHHVIYKRRRNKRKAGIVASDHEEDEEIEEVTDDNDDDDALPTFRPAPASPTPSQHSATVSTAIADPYDDYSIIPYPDLPKKPRGAQTLHKRKVLEAHGVSLSVLPAPPPSLHTKHLSNINTIIHLCLLRRDFNRASRAFRLLLGSGGTSRNYGLGPKPDLHDIWGLGVEILARKTDTDFTDVVEFLERLCVMYPYYRSGNKTGLDNAATLLPTLLHWKILGLTKETDGRKKGRTIREVERMIERIEELQISPPWVDDVKMWEMRGMLCLWAADLGGSAGWRKKAVKVGRVVKERGGEGWEDMIGDAVGDEGDDDDDDEHESEEEVVRTSENGNDDAEELVPYMESEDERRFSGDEVMDDRTKNGRYSPRQSGSDISWSLNRQDFVS